MRALSHCLVTDKAAKWREYKHCRQVCGRNHEVIIAVFSRVNFQYKDFVKSSQCQCETSLVERLATALKLFYSYIRKGKKGCPSVGPLKSSNGVIVSRALEMNELLVDAFSAVFVPGVSPDVAEHQICVGVFNDVVRSPVACLLSGLNGLPAAGLDGLHPYILRACPEALSLPMYLLFVRSLNDGVFPTLWETSVVTPLFKSENRFDPLNYCPVSLTSIFFLQVEEGSVF